MDETQDEEVNAIEVTPDMDPNELNRATCVYNGAVYQHGKDICYKNNVWRCGKNGKWFAVGKTC